MHGTLRTLGITFQQPSKGSLPQQGFGERGWRQPDFMLCGERRMSSLEGGSEAHVLSGLAERASYSLEFGEGAII